MVYKKTAAQPPQIIHVRRERVLVPAIARAARLDNITDVAANDEHSEEWEHLALLDSLKIQVIGIDFDHDDNDRGWCEE